MNDMIHKREKNPSQSLIYLILTKCPSYLIPISIICGRGKGKIFIFLSIFLLFSRLSSVYKVSVFIRCLYAFHAYFFCELGFLYTLLR